MGRPKAQFCKHGHDTALCGRDKSNACNDCKLDWFRENPNYLKEYYIENKDILDAKNKEYYETHKDEMLAKMKIWVDTHRELKVELDRKYYIENREKCLAAVKEWANNNRDIVRALKIKSQTNRQLRVVAWTDWPEIKDIYKKQSNDMEVDHYIPLQGELVSGFHLSWNLQYLTPEANRLKHNKIDLVEVSSWYGKILEQEGLK